MLGEILFGPAAHRRLRRVADRRAGARAGAIGGLGAPGLSVAMLAAGIG